jgi:D-xylulose 5-phosphate/D-fructose 6-phosphate phosphoketolase
VAAGQIGSSDAPALVDDCDPIGHCLLLSVPSGLPREPTRGSLPTSQRHGSFSCYEAFVHIADLMFNQHAKWLESTSEIAWRRPIASLNYLLTSHVWRQDHNGLSHQDPGFVDHVANKKAEIMQVYLPGRSVARGLTRARNNGCISTTKPTCVILAKAGIQPWGHDEAAT